MTLNDLKIGDKVIVKYNLSPEEVRTVAKVLKAHFVDDKGTKWSKDRGHPAGSSGYCLPTATPATEAGLKKVRRDGWLRAIRRCAESPTTMDFVSEEDVVAILKILKAAEAKKLGGEACH